MHQFSSWYQSVAVVLNILNIKFIIDLHIHKNKYSQVNIDQKNCSSENYEYH